MIIKLKKHGHLLCSAVIQIVSVKCRPKLAEPDSLLQSHQATIKSVAKPRLRTKLNLAVLGKHSTLFKSSPSNKYVQFYVYYDDVPCRKHWCVTEKVEELDSLPREQRHAHGNAIGGYGHGVGALLLLLLQIFTFNIRPVGSLVFGDLIILYASSDNRDEGETNGSYPHFLSHGKPHGARRAARCPAGWPMEHRNSSKYSGISQLTGSLVNSKDYRF